MGLYGWFLHVKGSVKRDIGGLKVFSSCIVSFSLSTMYFLGR